MRQPTATACNSHEFVTFYKCRVMSNVNCPQWYVGKLKHLIIREWGLLIDGDMIWLDLNVQQINCGQIASHEKTSSSVSLWWGVIDALLLMSTVCHAMVWLLSALSYIMKLMIIITLHAKLSGAVYCNRSSLFVCVCLFVVLLPW